MKALQIWLKKTGRSFFNKAGIEVGVIQLFVSVVFFPAIVYHVIRFHDAYTSYTEG